MPMARKKESVRAVLTRTLGKAWNWVNMDRISRVLSMPLPKGWWLQLSIIFVLAALPFVPLQLLTLRPTQLWLWPFAAFFIVGAGYAFLERVITSLLIAKEARAAILDKLVGARPAVSDKLAVLHKSPWRGFGQLVLTVLTVGCVVVISTASVSYSLINHFGFRSPFGVAPEAGAILWYFVDEATRGMSAHFFDAIHFTAPQKLQIDGDKRLSAWLGAGVWSYRVIVGALTVQVGWLLYTFLRAKADPRVINLHQRLRNLEEEVRKRDEQDRDREWEDEWQTIRQEANKNGGRLTKSQRRALKGRLEEIDNRHYSGTYYERSEEYDAEQNQIERQLQRDGAVGRQGRGQAQLSERKRERLEEELAQLESEKEESGWLPDEEFRRMREIQRILRENERV